MARARVLDVKPLRYVARQPIFDRDEKVFGYELLFRDGLENAFHGDSNEASRATLDRTLLMGLDVLRFWNRFPRIRMSCRRAGP